jgi:hypothetical protein
LFNCCAGAIDGILIWIHKPPRKIAWKSGATVASSCVLERRSLDLTAKQYVTFEVVSWTSPSCTLDRLQIVSHSKECRSFRSLKKAF